MDRSATDGVPIRVYLLSGRESTRHTRRHLLEAQGMAVVGEAGSAAEAYAQILALRPDVAVLDSRLGDGTGGEVCLQVRSADPAITCVIVAGDRDARARREAVLAGACGCLPEQISGGDLGAAIGRAAAGELLFDPEDEAWALEGAIEEAVMRRGLDLSPQESRVLELLHRGMTHRQIAHEMALAQKTAQTCVSSVLAKVGRAHRTEAPQHAPRPVRRAALRRPLLTP